MFRRFLLHSWKHSTREYITTECYPVTWSSFNQTPEKIWSGTSTECLHARFGSARASECLCRDLGLGNLLYHNFNFHGYHQNKWTAFCRITKHYHWLGWSSNILNPLTPVPAVTSHAKTHPLEWKINVNKALKPFWWIIFPSFDRAENKTIAALSSEFWIQIADL